MGGYPSSKSASVSITRRDVNISMDDSSSRIQHLRSPEVVLASRRMPDGDDIHSVPANLSVEVFCDDGGLILHADDNITPLLRYTPGVLLGEHIGEILHTS